MAVPFVPGPPNRVPSDSEKHLRVYTSSRTTLCHMWHVDTAPGQNTQKTECVLRRWPSGYPNKNLRVYTTMFSFRCGQKTPDKEIQCTCTHVSLHITDWNPIQPFRMHVYSTMYMYYILYKCTCTRIIQAFCTDSFVWKIPKLRVHVHVHVHRGPF